MKHRGKHPKDKTLFCEKNLPNLRQATHDLSLLLSKDYPLNASLKLVGDNFKLTSRQRTAVERCSCSDSSLKYRQEHLVSSESCKNRIIRIDGYNLIINIEYALSGGTILQGRDNAYRDLASIHGTYRKVEETIPAIQIVGNTLASLKVRKTIWHLDSPVSNSGRLKNILLNEAASNDWNWESLLESNPDISLAESKDIVVTSDSWILDRCMHWLNLMNIILIKNIPNADIVNLFKSMNGTN